MASRGSDMNPRWSSLVLALIALVLITASVPVRAQLQDGFYDQECPRVVRKIHRVMERLIFQDITIAASILRLHFHDCFVRGCDASILLRGVNGGLAERDAIPSLTLRGFEQIDIVKAEVEAYCPGRVSCADILAIAARESIRIISRGRVTWDLPLGRRDGNVSSVNEPLSLMPAPFDTYETLVGSFQKQGLTERDMVILSGAHTVGLSHCSTFSNRLYSSTAPGAVNGVDPTLDAVYAEALKLECKPGDTTSMVAMDPTGHGLLQNNTFDRRYFRRVLANEGLFTSDATLITVSTGAAIVDEMATDGPAFRESFGLSMTKMANIGVLTGTNGQVRSNCAFVNP